MKQNIIDYLKSHFMKLGVEEQYFCSIAKFGDVRKSYATVFVEVYKDRTDVVIFTYFGGDKPFTGCSKLHFTKGYKRLKALSEEIKKQMPSFSELDEFENRGKTLELSDLFE